MTKITYCTDEDCLVSPHASNCPDCFGFGFYDVTEPGQNPYVPISAADVEDIFVSEQCKSCGGHVINGTNKVE